MKKTRELPILLGVILLVFIMNFMVFRLAYLKEPVFLTHVFTAEQGDGNLNKLYYITNEDDQRTPVWVFWPELGEDISGEEPFWCMEEKTCGTYSVRTFALTYDFLDELPIENEMILTQMQIKWSDGTETLADVGELHIFAASKIPREDWTDGGIGFFDHIPYDSYEKTFLEDVTLTGVNMPLQDAYGDLLTVTDQNGNEITFPLVQETNDTFYMQTQFVIPEDDVRSHSVLALKPVLEGVGADGKPMRFFMEESARYVPEWSVVEIYRILHMKEAV